MEKQKLLDKYPELPNKGFWKFHQGKIVELNPSSSTGAIHPSSGVKHEIVKFFMSDYSRLKNGPVKLGDKVVYSQVERKHGDLWAMVIVEK